MQSWTKDIEDTLDIDSMAANESRGFWANCDESDIPSTRDLLHDDDIQWICTFCRVERYFS